MNDLSDQLETAARELAVELQLPIGDTATAVTSDSIIVLVRERARQFCELIPSSFHGFPVKVVTSEITAA